LPPTVPATNHDFTVIAHRGDHENGVPENTVAAYKQVIQHGADYVEVDLRTTRDGRFVIMHDQSVDRMTNGKGKVEDLSYAYIRSLKIQGTQNYKDKNYSVPNFKEVLKTCQGRINIYLDFKENNNVKKAYQLINKYDMKDQLVVYLNAEEQYGKWRKTAPEIPLMTSIPKGLNETQLDDLLNEYKIDIVDNAYDPERIEWLHQKDIT